MLMALVIFLSYALQFYVPMEVIQRLLRKRQTNSYENVIQVGLRTVLVTFSGEYSYVLILVNSKWSNIDHKLYIGTKIMNVKVWLSVCYTWQHWNGYGTGLDNIYQCDIKYQELKITYIFFKLTLTKLSN